MGQMDIAETPPGGRLPRQKRSDLVVDEIKRWIAAEGKLPGDRLPQERELMRLFGVSKGTIRESLKSLEVQGLIQINTGPTGGPVLSDVSVDVTSELLGNYFFFQQLDVQQIYQVRRLLEPELAAAAVPHLSPAQVARLERSVAICLAEPHTEEDQRQQRIEELHFHDILAEACPNPMLGFLCRFINHLLANLVTYKKVYFHHQEEVRAKNIAYHERILDAVRRRDAALVRSLMDEHMGECERHVIDHEAIVESRFLKRSR